MTQVHKHSWQPMLGAGLNLMCMTNEVSYNNKQPYYIIVWIQRSGVTIQCIPSFSSSRWSVEVN